MRGLTLDGVGEISYREDLPEPRLQARGDVIVAVTAAGLCGSDLHPYAGRERVRSGMVPGHEIVGEVVQAGPESSWVPGDTVLAAFTTSCGHCRFCAEGLSARCEHGQLFGYGSPDDDTPGLQGGQAEFARIPLADATAVRVPEGLTASDAALLTDNLPTAFYAVQRAQMAPGEDVAIVGLGSVGLCAVTAALAAGAGSVLAIDPVADRRRRAERLGAIAVSPDEVADAAESYVSVVEAAGTAPAQRLAFELTRAGGTLSIIAVQTDAAFPFTPVEAYDRNLTIRAGRAPVRSVLDALLPLIERAAVAMPTDVVVTHAAVSLADGPEIYRRFAAREEGVVKAIFAP